MSRLKVSVGGEDTGSIDVQDSEEAVQVLTVLKLVEGLAQGPRAQSRLLAVALVTVHLCSNLNLEATVHALRQTYVMLRRLEAGEVPMA